MAKIKAQANGNKDSAATWAGGVIPGPGDEAYANGFTVTVNTNWTVGLFTTALDASISAIAGGTFSITASITITGNAQTGIIASGTVNVLTLSSGLNFHLVGNLTAGGGKFDADGCNMSGVTSGTYTFTGNVSGGVSGNCWGIRAFHGTTALVIINGNVIGGSASAGISVGGSNTIINGNSVATAHPGILAFNTPGPGSTQLNGLSISSSTSYCEGVRGHTSLGHHYILIKGAVTTTVLGCHVAPYTGSVRFLPNPSISVFKQDGTLVTLTDPADTQDFPAASDVRNGVSYKNGDMLGTLKVPVPADVRKGIQTDNTVGTGEITAEDLLDAIQSSEHDVAKRLRACSTVATTAAQIAAAAR